MVAARWFTVVAGVMLLASHAHAQTASSANTNIGTQLQKMFVDRNSKQAMGQAVVIASLLGCTQKSAGQQQTISFYKQMETIGKQVEGFCKSGNGTAARTLLLETFTEQASHPVSIAALQCYDAQAKLVGALGGARMARDALKYARWLKDPELAKTQMQESDACKGYTLKTAQKTSD
jgi:hypothetical protein